MSTPKTPMQALLNSNRFWLLLLGALFAVLAVVGVIFAPEQEEAILNVLSKVELLVGLALGTDGFRRMGSPRNEEAPTD